MNLINILRVAKNSFSICYFRRDFVTPLKVGKEISLINILRVAKNSFSICYFRRDFVTPLKVGKNV
ncbi:hypothetical protein [Campylobacter majalis]|uniref:hypothetical protein n=1 Tax=Campylobacter majalis TaxID=2790656 RepID=UPI003D6845DB